MLKPWANLPRIVEKQSRTGKKMRSDTLRGEEGGDTRVKSMKSDLVMSKKVVSFSGENKQGWHRRTGRDGDD